LIEGISFIKRATWWERKYIIPPIILSAERIDIMLATDFDNFNFRSRKLVTGNSRIDRSMENARGINRVDAYVIIKPRQMIMSSLNVNCI
jgi:hypothetical protein